MRTPHKGGSFAEGAQEPPPAGAQQIADQTGELDLILLQKTFQLALEPHPVARHLVLRARQHAPARFRLLDHGSAVQASPDMAFEGTGRIIA